MSRKPSSPSIETFQDDEIEYEAAIDDYLGDFDEQSACETSAQCLHASRSHRHASEDPRTC